MSLKFRDINKGIDENQFLYFYAIYLIIILNLAIKLIKNIKDVLFYIKIF